MAFNKSQEREFQIALCTVPDQATGEMLAEKMVERSLAACVNIIPTITSVYQWQDKIEKDPESLLVIKTEADLMASLGELLDEEHPYEVYELISCGIDQASSAYLDWLKSTL
ncbi:divalent-cation tolerance protein CutA [Kangiella sediminilitoris]|uniref:CutA1 divalent ion tolerance protein n=1 Tax=Kangiella sediminilitoris TaxID=1144748 RepID=A0A1B3BDD4_9GAMM|nr:divalent-cation tolerance protein CutA [Kangiella sediminilitoris]AOE50839.1 CutA1 divalent ion tolerance protein [Kangiella sediminilitoris]